MTEFNGFSSTDASAVPVPSIFFSTLLPQIDHLGEMKVTLYAFANFNQQLSEPRYLRFKELIKDERLMWMFGRTRSEQEKNLRDSFDRACGRGTLLDAERENDTFYFLNSARGRAAREGLLGGNWHPDHLDRAPVKLKPERPNVFALYEQNIGPLTPILSETLKEAEGTYPVEWIEEALKIAVTKNVRNWRFIEAILKTWKEKGRDETNRRSSKEDRKRDSEGKFADYINR
jgi:DNA replication protein